MTEKIWRKESVFHTTMDNQIAIYANRQLNRLDIEKMIQYFTLALEIGCYDDDPDTDSEKALS